MILPARSQLIREWSLTPTDLAKIARCRGDPQRLGFAYQLGFVRVFQRFPVQQPLEICEELLSFSALQTGIDAELPLGTATPVPHPARAAPAELHELTQLIFCNLSGRFLRRNAAAGSTLVNSTSR